MRNMYIYMYKAFPLSIHDPPSSSVLGHPLGLLEPSCVFNKQIIRDRPSAGLGGLEQHSQPKGIIGVCLPFVGVGSEGNQQENP